MTLMPYGAADFVDDLRQKLALDCPDESTKIAWDVQAGDAYLQIDPQSLQTALVELFSNAFRHDRAEGDISFEVRLENDRFVFTIREPKRSFNLPPESGDASRCGRWGRVIMGAGPSSGARYHRGSRGPIKRAL